jgi:flagellar hook assembly protein FlgD
MSRTGSLLTLVVSWLFVSPALGSDLIVPVSQDRWVFAFAFAQDFMGEDEDSATVAASDFGLFQADTTVTATISFATAFGQASQTSEIQSASMQATGDISATGEGFDYDASFVAEGQSHFEVTFDVTPPVSFILSGDISASGVLSTTTVTLDGPSGPIVAISAANQTTPILETGAMEPGTHTLVVDAHGRGFGDFFTFFPASGSYNVLFTVAPVTGVPEIGPNDGRSFVVAPNPFREQTTISPRIPGTVAVDASIFDLQGRLVRELAGFEGDPTLSWDGRNRRGELVHPGVYFVRLEAGDEIHRLKITRIR